MSLWIALQQKIPRSTCVGVDLGNRSVKVLQLRLGLRSQAHKMLIPLRFKMANEIPWEDIRCWLSSNNLKGCNLVTGIADEKTESYEMRLPKIPTSEIKSAITWELKKSIAALDEMVFDWQSTSLTDGLEVRCTVMQKNVALDLFEHVHQIQGNPLALEPQSSALHACVRYLHSKQSLPFVIMDLGYSAFRFIFAEPNRILMTRTLYFGLSNLFQRVKTDLQFSIEDTEQILMENAGPDNQVRLKLDRVLEELLYTLCEEYLRSESFVIEKTGIQSFEKIYLSGGGACFAMVHEYLQKHLSQYLVHTLNPWHELEIQSESQDLACGPLWAGAMGLALYEVA